MKKEFLFIVVVIIFFTSCGTYRYIYSSSPHNNPYFKQKGDSKLTAYYSAGSDNNSAEEHATGFDLQGAYAIGDHWAITADYFNRKEKDMYGESYNMYDTSVVEYKRNLVGAGGGYFMPLNSKKSITANLYAGLAIGKFSFRDNGEDANGLIYNRYHESRIKKWFLQPSVNFMPGQYVRFSFSAKILFVHYGKIRTSYTDSELEYFSLDKIANRTLGFFEPSINFQFGIPRYPWIKIDGALSGTSIDRVDTRLAVRNTASVGLNFDISKMRKRKN
jgi:hypothetical protein